MVRWYYRSVFDELEDLRIYLESLNRQINRTNTGSLLLPADRSAMLLPAKWTGIPVEVSEIDDEVLVSAVFGGGTLKEDISLELVSPLALEIQYLRTFECRGVSEGHSTEERMSESIRRIVLLPVPVTNTGSSASYKEGSLEIHLKKIRKASEGKIVIR